MSTEYLIVKQETCPECKGKCVILHPAWKIFYKSEHFKFWRESKTADLADVAERFFNEHGYGRADIPAQEIECGLCEGTGKIRTEVDIREVLKDLKNGCPGTGLKA